MIRRGSRKFSVVSSTFFEQHVGSTGGFARKDNDPTWSAVIQTTHFADDDDDDDDDDE